MTDILTDRDCVILDGKCDCPRIPGKLPDCKKYPPKAIHESEHWDDSKW